MDIFVYQNIQEKLRNFILVIDSKSQPGFDRFIRSNVVETVNQTYLMIDLVLRNFEMEIPEAEYNAIREEIRCYKEADDRNFDDVFRTDREARAKEIIGKCQRKISEYNPMPFGQIAI